MCGETIDSQDEAHANVLVSPENCDLGDYSVPFCLECVAHSAKGTPYQETTYEDWISCQPDTPEPAADRQE